MLTALVKLLNTLILNAVVTGDMNTLILNTVAGEWKYVY